MYTLKIVKTIKESNDATTLCFKQPGLKKVKYLPGQYLTLIVRINGRKYIRPYSFSSAPGVDEFLEITIKRVIGGVVSNHLIDVIKEGDVLEVMQPLGDFILPPDAALLDRHIVLWGAGSGITPLMSIAKYALHYKIGAHVSLVYGNRNPSDVIFKDKIDSLLDKFGDRFSAWHFHTRLTVPVNNPNIIEGRINPGKVFSVMKKVGDFKQSLHYICGPAGLKESVKTSLIGLGVDVDNIFFEDFELIIDPAEFENITTQMVSVEKNGVRALVEAIKGKSILEAALDANIDLDYSCQTGNCFICKGKLLSGEVKMIGVQKSLDELMEDECLLCCSFPLTNDVSVLVV
ncbi:MAG: FAD-binding oxidoreductase [Bacteroidota bacterium]